MPSILTFFSLCFSVLLIIFVVCFSLLVLTGVIYLIYSYCFKTSPVRKQNENAANRETVTQQPLLLATPPLASSAAAPRTSPPSSRGQTRTEAHLTTPVYEPVRYEAPKSQEVELSVLTTETRNSPSEKKPAQVKEAYRRYSSGSESETHRV